jgi:uncharacterized protein YcbK (DUF882 family)
VSKLILTFLRLIGFKRAEGPIVAPKPPEPFPTPQLEVKMAEIDWTDHKAKVSEHFTVHEALWLPTWSRLANEADGLTAEVKSNLVIMFKKMDVIRNYLGKPILVHCAFRPPAYNKLIGGAAKSAHLTGAAIDFHVKDLDCDKVREMLECCLEAWNLRMEQLPNSNWVHLGNDYSEGKTRYFKP